MPLWLQISIYVVGPLIAATIGVFIRHILTEVKKMKDDFETYKGQAIRGFNDYQNKATELYARRDDVRHDFDSISAQLERIEKKMDARVYGFDKAS